MNRLTFICKLAAGFVFCLFTANFAQEIATDNHSKIGGLKLGEQRLWLLRYFAPCE